MTAVESTGVEAFEHLSQLLVASTRRAVQRVALGSGPQTLRLRCVDEHGADVQPMPQGMRAEGLRTVVGS